MALRLSGNFIPGSFSGVTAGNELVAPTFIQPPIGSLNVFVNIAASYDFSTKFANNLPMTYTSVGAALPAGLTLNSTTGVLSGTVTVIATTNGLQIRATNSANLSTDTDVFSIIATSAFAPPTFIGPTITTINLFTGSAITPINFSTRFSSEAPLTYTVQGGTLPIGLTLNSSTGILSGTPTQIGTFAGRSIRATNTDGVFVDSNTFSIVTAAATTAYTSITPVTYSTATTGTNVTVPAGTAVAEVKIWGSSGGTSSGAAAYSQGGTSVSYITVTPGETLSVRVGGIGNNGGAVGGSGSSGVTAGSGGGYSGVFRSTTPLCIAGGGGGGARNGSNGAAVAGRNGGLEAAASGVAGGGGTQTAGGIAGVSRSTNSANAANGGSLAGGRGAAATNNLHGGGGGGGFYGGGGGGSVTSANEAGLGGGGSNLCPALPTGTGITFPTQTGLWAPGKRLTQSGINSTDVPGYASPAGTNGNPGRIQIRWLPSNVDFNS